MVYLVDLGVVPRLFIKSANFIRHACRTHSKFSSRRYLFIYKTVLEIISFTISIYYFLCKKTTDIMYYAVLFQRNNI